MIRNKLFLLAFAVMCINSAYAKDEQVTTKVVKTEKTNVSEKTNANSSEALKALLSPVQNLQGNFEQSMVSENAKVLQKLSGKMHLKKPGKFRWEIIKPEPRLVIADGKKVWDYDKELDQVTVQKVVKGQSKAPIYFLTGEVDSLDKDFIITPVAQSANSKICMQKSDACFELKPKKGEGSFQWIRIGFKDKKIHELELLDQLGQRSRFDFTEVQINQEVPDSLFQFTAPKGVDVLENK